MSKHWIIVMALLLALLQSGCAEEEHTGPSGSDLEHERAQLAAQLQKNKGRKQARAKQKAGKAKGDAKSEAQMAGAFGALDEAYSYSREGKRDPFEPFHLEQDYAEESDVGGPLEQFELEQLEVVALVWDADRPRAMVSDPSGSIYTVQVGSRMGKNAGKVIHIGDNLVLVKETYVDYAGEQTTKDVEIRVRRGQGG